jgi:hypothetical protein
MDSELSGGARSSLVGRRTELGLGIAVSVLIVLYVSILLKVPDRLFADDSYFYFQVAWNFARGMGSTFNNIMPTNGYHPLWMLVLALVYKVVPSRVEAVPVIGGVIAALNLAMLWTVYRLLAKVAGGLWIVAFVLLIAFVFMSQLGTEGTLSGLLLALLMNSAYEMSKAPTAGRAAAYNVITVLAVLARLDNIFIVGFVWLAVWWTLGDPGKREGRRMQLLALPLYAVLWGGYLASNWIYFHTLQPISGMLKSQSTGNHPFGTNLPHTAWLGLAVIAICLPIVGVWKRDLFFRTVEVPFALGILCHAAYIVFAMSNETRWSWYYTSWILLSSVLMARVASIVLERRHWLVAPVGVVCVLVLAVGWWKGDYKRIYRGPEVIPPASFNEVVYKQAGLRRVFAYDQPGSLAYHSDLKVVPLDGLMGNIKFQHDLATKGIQAVATEEHIDGFIGPPVPITNTHEKELCEILYLSTVQFHCVPGKPGEWDVTGVDVYSRVPSAKAGTLALRNDGIVWEKPDFVAVWRLQP